MLLLFGSTMCPCACGNSPGACCSVGIILILFNGREEDWRREVMGWFSGAAVAKVVGGATPSVWIVSGLELSLNEMY